MNLVSPNYEVPSLKDKRAEFLTWKHTPHIFDLPDRVENDDDQIRVVEDNYRWAPFEEWKEDPELFEMDE